MSGPVTLTVVLRPARGGGLDPGGATVDTVDDLAPDPQAAARIRAFFADRGFEVGPIVANAFSVTVAPERAEPMGLIPSLGRLLFDELPQDLQAHVITIEAEPPLDFGPGSFS
jgi:hypothetical protein